ncbi:STAS domain-containing protein [Streptomyces sp. NRRL S-87]|uniref:STAS domain-containing protein n=1 Tax=Streptomyces sp. NRRL S-87 TaxID=1463920 RepID=UPI00056D80BB|nr:STAS domain-containing protein [Streptomyces sp. NRRL S-87]
MSADESSPADATGPGHEDREPARVVRVRGEFDLDRLAPLEQALAQASTAARVVILDASQITFGDSSFLNLLLHVNRQTRLRILRPQSQFRRLMALTGTDAVLDVREDMEDALRP